MENMEFIVPLEKWYLENKRDLPWRNTTDPYVIDFANVPAAYTASDKYGANLYTGGAGQITEGYKVQLGNSGTYVQFPVNYLEQEWGEEPRPWQYDYWNGCFGLYGYY